MTRRNSIRLVNAPSSKASAGVEAGRRSGSALEIATSTENPGVLG